MIEPSSDKCGIHGEFLDDVGDCSICESEPRGVEYPKCEGCGDSIAGIIRTEAGLCHEMCCKDVDPGKPRSEQPQKWIIEGGGIQWSVFEKSNRGTRLIVADLTHAQAVWIRDEHNAALAVEREKLEKLKSATNRLILAVNTHLLCGVPEIKTVNDVINGMRTVGVKLQCVVELEETKQQLLAAQTAIEHHNKKVLEVKMSPDYAAYLIPNIDLSFLREHDAEVRKPLVVWLERIKDYVNTNANPSMERVSEFCDAALAQIKE